MEQNRIGAVGADLQALTKRAQLTATERIHPLWCDSLGESIIGTQQATIISILNTIHSFHQSEVHTTPIICNEMVYNTNATIATTSKNKVTRKSTHNIGTKNASAIAWCSGAGGAIVLVT